MLGRDGRVGSKSEELALRTIGLLRSRMRTSHPVSRRGSNRLVSSPDLSCRRHLYLLTAGSLPVNDHVSSNASATMTATSAMKAKVCGVVILHIAHLIGGGLNWRICASPKRSLRVRRRLLPCVRLLAARLADLAPDRHVARAPR